MLKARADGVGDGAVMDPNIKQYARLSELMLLQSWPSVTTLDSDVWPYQ